VKTFIGFEEALELTLSNVSVCSAEDMPLLGAAGRVLAEDILAEVDSPSVSSSRKDGFAVVPEDLANASTESPVTLRLVGSLSAGDWHSYRIGRGQAVRLTTGARMPENAGAVIAEEFCRILGDSVICANSAEAGRNILRQGTDVRSGEVVARRGQALTPACLGLIAAAGRGRIKVHKVPRTAVIATGDEVMAPGEPLQAGKLYASNLIEICACLSLLGIPFETAIIRDRRQDIREVIQNRLPRSDVFITSGGAWGSEKDLILEAVSEMSWSGIYHRVRMGPGKPVGFGLLAERPFFILPGGPPANEMAFLQLALPALLKMKGGRPGAFPRASASLAQTVTGELGWTEFIHARLERRAGQLMAVPLRLKSRLKSMAEKEALIVIPEDREEMSAGEVVQVQLLEPILAA
jgi:molybdopterin molybdotransferase